MGLILTLNPMTLTFMVFLGVNEPVKYIVVILVSTPIILNLVDLYEF